MENMALAVPGQPALASEYNKVVGNVNELGRGTLFYRYDVGGQSIPTGWQKLRFDTIGKSSDYVSTNANMDEFTILTTGVYDLAAGFRLPGTGGGARHVRISTAASYNDNFAGVTFYGGDPNVSGSCSRPTLLQAGTVLSVYCYQAQGSLTTQPVGQSNFVAIRYCGES